jgi:hypothetical protein
MRKGARRIEVRMSADEYAELIRAAAVRSFAQAAPCILCGGRAEMRGIFLPGRPSDYGAPQGKMRVFIYAICAKCCGQPTSVAKVEACLREKTLSREPERWN